VAREFAKGKHHQETWRYDRRSDNPRVNVHLPTDLYVAQSKNWPSEGRHILAHYDSETIVVYQAYKPSTGRDAIDNGIFDRDFSYARMSWIKPNFLWMMYRSGWGTKAGQEITLGLRLRRQFFDSILGQAVGSSFEQSGYATHEEWKNALPGSAVRLQWDPDHDPGGRPLSRRAIQLGLSGPVLDAFGKRELLEVVDMTAFVAAQREQLSAGGRDRLRMPIERTYVSDDPSIARRLKLSRNEDAE
jgi:hypothetical protein